MRILSWNVSRFEPPHGAPVSWSAMHGATFLAKLVEATRPAAVALQEAPAPDFDLTAYMPSTLPYARAHAVSPSHCGVTQLYVDADQLAIEHEQLVGPSIAVRVRSACGRRLWLASGHLCPGKGGASMRHAQLERVVEACGDCDGLVWIGDANMRESERAPSPLSDVYDRALDPTASHRYTWDGFANRYHGPAAKPFRCRFDRCFVRADTSTARASTVRENMARLNVVHGAITKDRTAFLSDHFGIHVEISIGRA